MVKQVLVISTRLMKFKELVSLVLFFKRVKRVHEGYKEERNADRADDYDF